MRKNMPSPKQYSDHEERVKENERKLGLLEDASEYASTDNFKSVGQVLDMMHQDMLDMKGQLVTNDTSTVSINKDIDCLKNLKSELSPGSVASTATEEIDVPSIDFDDF